MCIFRNSLLLQIYAPPFLFLVANAAYHIVHHKGAAKQDYAVPMQRLFYMDTWADYMETWKTEAMEMCGALLERHRYTLGLRFVQPLERGVAAHQPLDGADEAGDEVEVVVE